MASIAPAIVGTGEDACAARRSRLPLFPYSTPSPSSVISEPGEQRVAFEEIRTRWKVRLRAARRPALALAVGLLLAGGAALVAARIFALSHETPSLGFRGVQKGAVIKIPDDWLGSALRPNSRVNQEKFHDNRLFADVVYTVDECGRRTTVQPAGAYESFAVFGPCSFTFGDGVNDDQTLASQFAGRLGGKKIHVCNYGVSGWGPTNFLALATDPRLPRCLREPRGFVVYTFIDPHVDRAIGRMALLDFDAWSRFPYYRIGPGGVVVRAGLIDREHPPPLPRFYRLLRRLGVASVFYPDWPKSFTDDHYRFTAKIIEETAREFGRRFTSAGFYVVLFPGAKNGAKVMSFADPALVRVLDYSTMLEPKDTGAGTPYFQLDGHPTPLLLEMVAGRLVADLTKAGAL
jgi:hypothetical protein